MNKAALVVLAVVGLIGGYFFFTSSAVDEKKVGTPKDYKDIEYMIEGKKVTLSGAYRYFGNTLVTDLNDDGRDDVVFLVTHEPGGSGTFFYAVAVLTTEDGYAGSDGYLLGDRIAPQTTELSQNPRHMPVAA